MLIFYPIPHATSRTEALARAAKLCRCVRKSFAGIRWREGLTIPGGTGAMRFLILGALGLGGSLYLGHCLWLAWLAWWLG